MSATGQTLVVATGDAVVTLLQFIFTGGLPKAWEQGRVILAVLWFSAGRALMRLRMTQNYVNRAVVGYGAVVFVIGGDLRVGVRRLRHVPQPVDAAVHGGRLAAVARRPRRRLGARRDRDLLGQPVHPPARAARALRPSPEPHARHVTGRLPGHGRGRCRQTGR